MTTIFIIKLVTLVFITLLSTYATYKVITCKDYNNYTIDDNMSEFENQF